MANILFCWELGGALGHAGRLKSLALPLIARGHTVSFVLRDLVHTRRLLRDVDVPKFQAPPFDGPRIAWARGPVDLGAALPACAFAVCHAGESTVSQSLLAGVPLLLMPESAESFLTAQRVRELGAGINIDELARPLDWAAIVRGMLQGEGYRAAAQDFARRHAGFDALGQAEALAAVLETVLETAPGR
jgi:UDP:flavonoid glycosyltransferase YjiC (YdhE family)